MSLGYVIDCSVRLDAELVRLTREAGYRGVVRYLYDGPKGLTRDEAKTILAGDLELAVVYESSADRARDGYPAGVADAHTANGLANAIPELGLDRPIYYACDFDARWDEVAPYFTGVAEAGVRRLARTYAGIPIITSAIAAGVSTGGWVAAASSWSHGQTTDLAALWQRVGAVLGPLPFDYDENAVTLPDWGQTPIVSPQPAQPRGDEMLYRTVDGGVTTYYRDASGILVALAPEEAAPYYEDVVNGKIVVVDLGGVLSAFAFNARTIAALKATGVIH